MTVKAQAKYIRMSSRKIRLIADLIRGLGVEEAEIQLNFINKTAVRPLLKLLKSAAANASHNFKLKKENLYIKEIRVDGGPTLKRWKPRAFGRATPIRKRSSHVAIILDERKKGKISPKKEVSSEKEKLPKEKLTVVSTLKSLAKEKKVLEKPEEAKAPEIKKIPKEYKAKGFLKKIFSRKTG